MKKLLLRFSTSMLLIGVTMVATAQPTHVPISVYKYQNSNNGYSKSVLPGTQSHSSLSMLDVAASQNHHFQCGTATFTGTGNRMFLCKKDAVTGAPVTMSNANAGILFGEPESSDECKGMLLDEPNNRVYLFGTMQNPGDFKRAVVICYNMTTMAVETNFSYGFGVQSVNPTNTESEVIDMALTPFGDFVILMNVKDANGKYYMRLAQLNLLGDWISQGTVSNGGYECYGTRIRYYFDVMGNVFVAGKATNASGQVIPMFWAIDKNSYVVLSQTAAQFTSPLIGNGTFVDFSFSHNYGKLIVIGNNTSNNGIYVNLKPPVTNGANFTYDATYKNTATLPGLKTGLTFKRMLIQTDDYVTILSGFASANGNLGYLTPTGTAYVATQNVLLQHSMALNKDSNGNIIIGGCSGGLYATAKFTCYSGYWPVIINKLASSSDALQTTNELTVATYPNPATDFINVMYSGVTTGNENINVLDITGKKVLEFANILFINKQTTIDLGTLKNGTYFIQLNTAEKQTIQKIIKQ